MATLKQIDANRRNSQRSTGPRTLEGKRAASTNALQSGIYAEKEVLPFEDASQLETLAAEYQDRFRPTTPEARALVDSLVHHEWLLRRLRRAEAALYYCECAACAKNYSNKSECTVISGRLSLEFKKFDHIQRRINATERNYHRSLKALQALEPPPEEPAQPEEPKPTSGKLASYPENHPEPGPGPTDSPEKATPSDSCLLSPDFPKVFLRNLREQSSVDSVKNPRPQTLETPSREAPDTQ